jgi:hypothetical protein
MSKRCRNSVGRQSGPKAVPADRAIVAYQKTCSETVEHYRREGQIIGGNVPVPPTNTQQKRRIARSSIIFSLLCLLCHAIARALGRRFRSSLDDAREELT